MNNYFRIHTMYQVWSLNYHLTGLKYKRGVFWGPTYFCRCVSSHSAARQLQRIPKSCEIKMLTTGPRLFIPSHQTSVWIYMLVCVNQICVQPCERFTICSAKILVLMHRIKKTHNLHYTFHHIFGYTVGSFKKGTYQEIHLELFWSKLLRL